MFKQFDLYDDVPAYGTMTGAELTRRLYTKDPATGKYFMYLYELDWKKLNPGIRRTLNFFSRTSFSYDFTLDNTEVNNHGAGLDFVGNSFGQQDKVPLTFKDEKTREVERNFRIFDNFEDFIKSEKFHKYCESFQPYEPNWHYPIAGTTRIQELVKTFLDLNKSGNLTGSKEKPLIPTVADTVTFTTKVTANINPGIALNPVVSRLTPTFLQFTNENNRTDLHKVIILLSLEPSKGGFVTARANQIARIGRASNNVDILASQELNQQRDYSTQNSIIAIPRALNRISP
ncbi:hypothetical protein [Methylobacterium haplocladii]|uniref:hypothetical protein n=1 Tax=Methylobacterium haplocladii TaxID=1176176 RepID=UPI0011BF07AA|nr:hypothetical protein [Methylobacterium haplocladii]GJD85002.1 hypothetical protein HPGCJGGD_2887 [Methylobacterium haplocladii]GLS58877.1 hypothetical protein GCM10007887_15430 [Methylobacterium haplocladii]